MKSKNDRALGKVHFKQTNEIGILKTFTNVHSKAVLICSQKLYFENSFLNQYNKKKKNQQNIPRFDKNDENKI